MECESNRHIHLAGMLFEWSEKQFVSPGPCAEDGNCYIKQIVIERTNWSDHAHNTAWQMMVEQFSPSSKTLTVSYTTHWFEHAQEGQRQSRNSSTIFPSSASNVSQLYTVYDAEENLVFLTEFHYFGWWEQAEKATENLHRHKEDIHGEAPGGTIGLKARPCYCSCESTVISTHQLPYCR